MHDSDRPEWQELLHPVAEVIHPACILAAFYVALVGDGLLPPPAFFAMEGLTPGTPLALVYCFAFLIFIAYPLGLLFQPWPGERKEYVSYQQKAKDWRFGRCGLAVFALCWLFFQYTCMLGIAQSANGFDWNRRWPADGSEPARFYQQHQ